MLRGDGVIVGSLELGRANIIRACQSEKMRPVGLAADKCGKAVGPSCDDR